jgi:hypothetical protein
MRKKIFLMAILSSTLLHGQSSEISVDTVTNYKSWGWKWQAIVMQNNLITLAIVPAIGGRVMQYDLGGHSSIFINPAELGKTYTPSQFGQWHNLGGYKTWPAPQSRWPSNWPPPSTLDCGNYTSQIDSTTEDSVSVLVTSPVEQWVAPGIQFERRATIYSGTSRVKMEQTIINTGTSAVSWGMWSIMQAIVNHPDERDYENFWVYFPINPHSVYGKSGVSPQGGSSDAWKGEIAPGVYGVQYSPDSKLIYADPHKGWIAYSDLRDSVVYATTFDIFEGASYPDNARVTVYVNDTTTRYLEVEVKAPIVELAAGGGSYTFVENWWAAKVRAPILYVNQIGAIAGRMSFNPATQKLSAIYGVFHKGTAHVVFVDSLGQILSEGQSFPVSPLAEFQLQDTVVIPESAKTIEVRIYNTKDELIGTLDSTNVLDLLTAVEEKTPDIASEYHLAQNYPNPFNPSTNISFSVAKTEYSKLSVYNLLGKQVAVLFDGIAEGQKENIVTFDASQFASGVYFYKLQTATWTDVRKMLLMK